MPARAHPNILELRSEITEAIRRKRPKLAESSLKTYANGLSNLYTKLDGEGGLHWLSHAHAAILEHTRSIQSLQTRKTLLSALLVLTGMDEYKEPMMDGIRQVQEQYREQKTNPTRLENLIPFERVQAIHEHLKQLWRLNPTVEHTVNLLISYLTSGALGMDLPPRRLEIASLKMRNADPKSDNYVSWKTRELIYQKYKTSKSHGKEVVPIPKELMTILNRWKKINETEWLLVNNKGEVFKPSTLSKRIGTLFQGNTIDSLRSVFLSHMYRGLPALQQMEETARRMGHSVDAALGFYVKRDSDSNQDDNDKA
jgi:integrase